MQGREILLGVSGGVAAYKIAALASRLVQEGANVSVAISAAGEKFVGPATFEALIGRPAATAVFDSRFPLGAHIELSRRADLLVFAPATADLLFKMAHGAADDLLSTLYLAFEGPVLAAPAMNRVMWSKASVRRNVETLRNDGVQMIGPDEGWQSCREVGAGRMASPEQLFDAIQTRFAKQPNEKNI